ncbi:hypothetical protein [Hymenobacter sp. 102]|uniref:hypothetical protein n=1 Tax=Hymenobacter sp. 102 TaxID=3403152 RepID=UPI003CFB818E
MDAWTALALVVIIGGGFYAVLRPFWLYQGAQKRQALEAVYVARWWQIGWQTWLMNGVFLVMALLLLKSAATLASASDAILVLILTGLPFGVMFGITWQLHRSYWHHDQRAALHVRPTERTAVYYNHGIPLVFKFDDITGITWHTSRYSSSLWSDYDYQVLYLRSEEQILITCLLDNGGALEPLFPGVPVTRQEHRICWLPAS